MNTSGYGKNENENLRRGVLEKSNLGFITKQHGGGGMGWLRRSKIGLIEVIWKWNFG